MLRDTPSSRDLKPAALAEQLGLEFFAVKDDGRNPTASFKDRASAVVVARARQIAAEVCGAGFGV